MIIRVNCATYFDDKTSDLLPCSSQMQLVVPSTINPANHEHWGADWIFQRDPAVVAHASLKPRRRYAELGKLLVPSPPPPPPPPPKMPYTNEVPDKNLIATG